MSPKINVILVTHECWWGACIKTNIYIWSWELRTQYRLKPWTANHGCFSNCCKTVLNNETVTVSPWTHHETHPTRKHSLKKQVPRSYFKNRQKPCSESYFQSHKVLRFILTLFVFFQRGIDKLDSSSVEAEYVSVDLSWGQSDEGLRGVSFLRGRTKGKD